MGRRLKALEEAVGQTLFQRTGDGFILTDEGEAVLSHAERIEEEVLAFQRRLAGEDSNLKGCSAFRRPTGLALTCLRRCLPNFPNSIRAS
jgi:DNA-binding transcriptional LysR family regulator